MILAGAGQNPPRAKAIDQAIEQAIEQAENPRP